MNGLSSEGDVGQKLGSEVAERKRLPDQTTMQMRCYGVWTTGNKVN